EKRGANLFVIVKCERVVWPSRAFQSTVRPLLPSNFPTDPQQGCEQLPRLDRLPPVHATDRIFVKGSGIASPCSMQSAATRNASARTAAIAESRVMPYAMTPGMDSISAHHRPSSSRPTTIGIDS